MLTGLLMMAAVEFTPLNVASVNYQSGGECMVTDVKVNGTSVVTDKVANVTVPSIEGLTTKTYVDAADSAVAATIAPTAATAANTAIATSIGTNGIATCAVVDTKIAAASYAMTNALVKLNKSVQYVSASGEITIQAPTAVEDKCRDWVVYVNATAAAPLNLTQLSHVYVADAAYTNACAAGKVTALYITEMTSGTFAIGRQELTAVK